ncbi:hypothetical protein ACOI1H_20165 [Loktanella sp. DJP18]|uniref:hypothetical protein n=1 Tax=Loktanella sp. DJP18 TaxID=3409788 RepID=UPI003BB597A8
MHNDPYPRGGSPVSDPHFRGAKQLHQPLHHSIVNKVSRQQIDRKRTGLYLGPMRNWIRLVTLCLSLALLGGILMHDAATAQMPVRMASHAMAADSVSDQNCPACLSSPTDTAACDLDCTTPVLLFASAPSVTAVKKRDVDPAPVVNSGLHGFDPGIEPSPPRDTILI